MTTPTRQQIIEKSLELWHKENMTVGTRTAITPTIAEMKESGFYQTAQHLLMCSNPYKIVVEKPSKSTFKPTAKFTDFYDLLDLEECKASNILVSGTNKTGKSRLACGVASVLQSLGWKVIAFDNSGSWKSISDIPNLLVLEPNRTEYNLPLTKKSLLVDISNLTLDKQKELVDSVCSDIWINRGLYGSGWLLLILEEFELYAKNLRGTATQNLKRICHAGRNKQVRVLGVTTDLSLVDPSFIRLTQQRFHARLGIEVNCKRRFRGYYGKEWLEVATRLQLGEFIRLVRDQLSLVRVPLFEPKRKPQLQQQPQPQQQTKGSLFKRFIDLTVRAWEDG